MEFGREAEVHDQLHGVGACCPDRPQLGVVGVLMVTACSMPESKQVLIDLSRLAKNWEARASAVYKAPLVPIFYRGH